MIQLPDINGEKLAITFGAIIGFVIEIVVFAIVNMQYKKSHKFSLTFGGMAMFVALALLGLGIGLIASSGNLLGIIPMIVFLAIAVIVAVVNIRRLGIQDGVRALILETLLCVGALFDLESLMTRIEQRRAQKGKSNGRHVFHSDALNTFNQSRENYYNYLNRYNDQDSQYDENNLNTEEVYNNQDFSDDNGDY